MQIANQPNKSTKASSYQARKHGENIYQHSLLLLLVIHTTLSWVQT